MGSSVSHVLERALGLSAWLRSPSTTSSTLWRSFLATTVCQLPSQKPSPLGACSAVILPAPLSTWNSSCQRRHSFSALVNDFFFVFFKINKYVCGVEFAPITVRARWLNIIGCYVPCHWQSLSPVHLWLGYWWQQSPHWFCWFGIRVLWTHPDPLCRKKLERGERLKRKCILLPVLTVSEQGLIQMTLWLQHVRGFYSPAFRNPVPSK